MERREHIKWDHVVRQTPIGDGVKKKKIRNVLGQEMRNSLFVIYLGLKEEMLMKLSWCISVSAGL